jgi:hypothetical protein
MAVKSMCKYCSRIFIINIILLQLSVHPVAVDLTLIQKGKTIHKGNNTKQST